MENTGLLNTPYSDNESNADSDINSSKVITSQRCSKSQQRLAICRVVLDLLVLLLLGILIILVAGRYNTVKNRCIQHHLPVGSDLSGFVPADVSSRPTLRASGPDAYTLPAEAFEDLALLNQTVASWTTLTNAFVLATPYDGRGPQIPFETKRGDLFEISAFHQIHCLTTILEDFGMLQAGIPREELPGAHDGVVLTWAEHKAHCFNYIRQSLMCHADSTAEGHMEGNVRRVADQGVLHICNDFGALLDWAAQPERILPAEIIIHS